MNSQHRVLLKCTSDGVTLGLLLDDDYRAVDVYRSDSQEFQSLARQAQLEGPARQRSYDNALIFLSEAERAEALAYRIQH